MIRPHMFYPLLSRSFFSVVWQGWARRERRLPSSEIAPSAPITLRVRRCESTCRLCIAMVGCTEASPMFPAVRRLHARVELVNGVLGTRRVVLNRGTGLKIGNGRVRRSVLRRCKFGPPPIKGGKRGRGGGVAVFCEVHRDRVTQGCALLNSRIPCVLFPSPSENFWDLG